MSHTSNSQPQRHIMLVSMRIKLSSLLLGIVGCIYGVSSQPCVPMHGKTAVIIGQDYGSITNYTTGGCGHSRPFGFMSYTSLRSLAGLKESTDYGSGVQWAGGLSKSYPGSAIQIGLWIVGDCKKIATGKYDEAISKLSQYLGSTDEFYYLRIGYEFDSLQNNYPVDRYKQAFQHIVSSFRNASVTNVAFVWHASGFEPRDGYTHESWFPGVDYVNWCGVSLFQQPYDPTLMRHANEFALLCNSLNLPLMIAESTPFGGILDETTARSNPDATNRAGYSDSTWSRWFVPVLAYIQRHDVRVWSYINCDWDAQPMWAKFHAPGVYWGDSRIQAHEDVLRRWEVDVLSSSRFILSYESALDDHLCENLPHPAGQYFSAYFMWQLLATLLIVTTIVFIGYKCKMGAERYHADDTVFHQ